VVKNNRNAKTAARIINGEASDKNDFENGSDEVVISGLASIRWIIHKINKKFYVGSKKSHHKCVPLMNGVTQSPSTANRHSIFNPHFMTDLYLKGSMSDVEFFPQLLIQ